MLQGIQEESNKLNETLITEESSENVEKGAAVTIKKAELVRFAQQARPASPERKANEKQVAGGSPRRQQLYDRKCSGGCYEEVVFSH